MKIAGSILILVVLLLLAAQVLASGMFRAKGLKLAARLYQGPSGQDRSAELPPLVAAFAHRAGAKAGAGLSAVSFSQAGELRLKRGGFFVKVSARQIIGVGRTGFLWRARQGVGPFTKLRVIDALVEGDGLLDARLLGAFPVARSHDVETTLAEAYRYLAELPWAPDAMLGNPDLQWRMTDDRAAEVKLDTRVGTARVTFHFDAAGDIVEIEARDRPARDQKGRAVRYDWRGRYGEYAQIGNRRLPVYGEVGYVYPEGYEIYFRGRISDYRPAN